MTKLSAIKHYGTQVKLAAALGIKQATVSGWGEYPPAIRQLQLQQLTKGRLKAEPGLLSIAPMNKRCRFEDTCVHSPNRK